MAWIDYTDNSFWLPLDGFVVWDAAVSKWRLIDNGLVITGLNPIGGWEVGFRPTRIRLTFEPGTGGADYGTAPAEIFDTSNNQLAPTINYTEPGGTYEEDLSFVGLDIDRLEIRPIMAFSSGVNYSFLAKIEFFVESSELPEFWDEHFQVTETPSEEKICRDFTTVYYPKECQTSRVFRPLPPPEAGGDPDEDTPAGADGEYCYKKNVTTIETVWEYPPKEPGGSPSLSVGQDPVGVGGIPIGTRTVTREETFCVPTKDPDDPAGFVPPPPEDPDLNDYDPTVNGYWQTVEQCVPARAETEIEADWQGTAVSIGNLPADGEFKFNIPGNVTGVVMGLDPYTPKGNEPYHDYREWDYAVHFSQGKYKFYRRGLQVTGQFDYSGGETFGLLRLGNHVFFVENSVEVYKWDEPYLGALHAYTALYLTDDCALNYRLLDYSNVPSGEPAPTDYRDTILADSPSSYWRLNEDVPGTTTTATDLVGGRDGTYGGSAGGGKEPAIEPCQTAAKMNGTPITVADTDVLAPDLGGFSVEFWFKTDGEADKVGLIALRSGQGEPWVIERDGNRFDIGRDNGDKNRYDIPTWNDGVWHHVVVVVELFNDRPIVYFDGDTLSRRGGANFNKGQADQTMIGGQPDGGFWDGYLAEVAVYSSELTTLDVIRHALAANPGAPCPPQGNINVGIINVRGAVPNLTMMDYTAMIDLKAAPGFTQGTIPHEGRIEVTAGVPAAAGYDQGVLDKKQGAVYVRAMAGIGQAEGNVITTNRNYIIVDAPYSIVDAYGRVDHQGVIEVTAGVPSMLAADYDYGEIIVKAQAGDVFALDYDPIAGSLNEDWPVWGLNAQAIPGQNRFRENWPGWRLDARAGGGAALEWPGWTLQAQGEMEAVARLQDEWPGWAALGELDTGSVIRFRANWPAWKLEALGSGLAELTWPGWTASGVLETGYNARAELVWPGWRLVGVLELAYSAEARLEWPQWTLNSGSTRVDLQWPGWTLEGRLIVEDQSDVPVDQREYVAWVMNTATQAVTRYTNFNFTRFARFRGRHFGVQNGQLYELDGPDDDGTPIDASFRLFNHHFGETRRKRITLCYLYTRGTDGVVLDAITDEDKSYRYEIPEKPGSPAGIHMRRVKVSRGLRSTTWGWEISNRQGGELDISALEFAVEPISKRTE